jgi:hypothetical protein
MPTKQLKKATASAADPRQSKHNVFQLADVDTVRLLRLLIGHVTRRRELSPNYIKLIEILLRYAPPLMTADTGPKTHEEWLEELE